LAVVPGCPAGYVRGLHAGSPQRRRFQPVDLRALQVLALGISRTNASVMNIPSGMHLLQTMTRILHREPFLLVLDAAAYDYICNDMSS